MFQPESSEHADNKAKVFIARKHLTILYATFIDLPAKHLDGMEDRICYNFF